MTVTSWCIDLKRRKCKNTKFGFGKFLIVRQPTNRPVTTITASLCVLHPFDSFHLRSYTMPRKRPSIPLRRHYSADLKQRVIYQAYTLHRRAEDIATDLNMPLRVVQRVKKTWNEIGEVCRDRRHQGRAPLLSPQETQVC